MNPQQTDNRQLYIVGIGMGNPQNLTAEAQEAILSSTLLIGARRMLEPYREQKRCMDTHRVEEIIEILDRENRRVEESREISPIAVLVSGDSGFYSITRKLLAALNAEDVVGRTQSGTAGYDVTVLPGISSLSYFCAQIGRSWEAVKILNLHGEQENLWLAALTHEKVFAVTGGNVAEHLRELAERGMGNTVYGYVGENLSYEDERIRQGTVEELLAYDYGTLNVLFLENPDAVGTNLTGLPDDCFVRGETPMTKAEVRAVVMSRLRVRERDILYDVGAGTGSVSVEMALAAERGMVYAVEKDSMAVELCKLNKERFGLHNVIIVQGEAPDALWELPVPDAAFIGGSKGHLREIIALLVEKNPAIRLVINTVTVENTNLALELLDTDAFTDLDVMQLQVSRARKVGKSHMMVAQNPITILSARGSGIRKSDAGRTNSRE